MNSTMVWLWVQVHHPLLGILLVVLLGLVEWVKIMREERFREEETKRAIRGRCEPLRKQEIMPG